MQNTNFKDFLVLIDGSSFIYRAYFAIPGYLSTKTGIPTKAIFGVTQMILKILRSWDPKYIVWFMDEAEPTFRHKVFKDYKATRPKMPDDLKIQIPYIKKIITALGIPIISAPGYEADDLIATFVATFNLPTIIVAGDRDLYSIINDKVVIYDPVRDKLMDKTEFLKRYQFPPEVFPEFRALTGDKSDNIPGVPGIGEKTAITLLSKFKNLENIYQNLNKLPVSLKLRENLSKYKEQVFQNISLLKLNLSAPLPSTELEFYKRKELDYQTLKSLFKELEFRKLLSDIEIPERKMEIPEILSSLPEEALKSERSFGIYPFQPQTGLFASLSLPEIFLAFSENKVCKIPFEKFRNLILEIFADSEKQIFIHDYKNFFKTTGFSLMKDEKVFDLKLSAYLLNPGLKKYELENILQDYADINIGSIKGTPEEKAGLKACGILIAGKKLFKKLEEEKLIDWLFKVEEPLSEVLVSMEKKGIKIDIDYVRELSQEYQKKIRETEEKLFEIAGYRFNPRSSQEIGRILFNKLKLPPVKKTPKSALPSTDAEVLEELAPLHPFVRLLLQYRSLYKLKSTYIDAFLKYASLKDHRIHTEFNQTGTATGRLSSQNPNLQNIPVKGEEGLAIRRAFISEDGYFLCSLDYSQIELRILAHFSQDENLKKAFEKGEDIHTYTACIIFGVPAEKVTPEMRRLSKTINFGIAYGMSAYGLSKEIKVGIKEAEAFIERYFARYPGIKEYIEKTKEFAKTHGYVKTLVGRKRYVPEILSPNKGIREFGERIAVNTPIQGSAADLIKTAMVMLYKEIKKQRLKAEILLQIHDELILEVSEDEITAVKKLATEIMEEPFSRAGLSVSLNVPIKVSFSYGKNWAECKE